MQILYTLIIAAFFSGLFYYLINYALIPYTSENILDVKNLIIVSCVLIAVIACLFAVFHAGIDKLFFLKFYQKSRIFPAIRRGVLIGVWLIALVWMRIFGFWFWHIAIFVTVLILLIEALFVSFTSWLKRRRSIQST